MKISISTPCCYTAQGKKPNQEDSLFPPLQEATADDRVFMVCDGMGGHENGEVASACVAETIGRMTATQPLCTTAEMRATFEEALQQAYRNLDELDHSDSKRKMGTTLTFLALCTDGVLVAHIGDSRVYQVRPGKGIVFQTRDHSLVNDLIAAGELTEDEARTFPQRNVITRAIQPHQEYPAKASYNILSDIRKGDLFLLCCDGVVEQLENSDLCTCLQGGKSPEEKLAAIEKECLQRDTRDNNTAYLIEVTEVQGAKPVAEVVLHKADRDTLPQLAVRSAARWCSARLVMALGLVVTIVILAFVFLSSGSHSQSEKTSPAPVQGPIQRHQNL